jgi:hypothetical protein
VLVKSESFLDRLLVVTAEPDPKAPAGADSMSSDDGSIMGALRSIGSSRPLLPLTLMLAIASPLFGSFETFSTDVLVEVWGYTPTDAGLLSSVAQSKLARKPSDLICTIYVSCDKRSPTDGLRMCRL